MADRTDKEVAISIFITMLFIILSTYIFIVINESMSENSNLENARDFHIIISYNFNNTHVHGRLTSADIEVDLKMHYPRGTLIVDDPVEITGNATLNSLNAQNVRDLTVAFQNAQAWPVTQNSRGITQETNLYLDRIQNERQLTNKTTMVWALEGTYSPSLLLQFKDGTTQPTDWIKDATITVYPRSQFVQIITNKAILLLTIPAFFLAFASIFKFLQNFLILTLLGEVK